MSVERANALTLVLYDLQSPINIGMILRVAETYRAPVVIHDRSGILADPDKRAVIADFACGAAERRGWRVIASDQDIEELRSAGRLIATSIEPGSRSLPDHDFRYGDVVLLGNEHDGLPQAVLDRADFRLHVPMPDGFAPKPRSRSPIDPSRAGAVARDGRPSLNVAMTAGIICYTAFAAGLRRTAARTG